MRVSVVELDRGECVALLATVPVGRVGVSIGALPVILPVNFALMDGTVLFRTVPGTKLDAATHGTVVAFEADGYAPDGTTGWSVLVIGRASEIRDPAELARARAIPLTPWAVGDRAEHFVRVELARVSGRRFGS